MHLKDYVKPSISEKTYLRIKVTPRQNKSELFSVMEDWTFKIRIKGVPENGKANEELVRFISEELDIRKDKIEIISGAGDTTKLIRLSA